MQHRAAGAGARKRTGPTLLMALLIVGVAVAAWRLKDDLDGLRAAEQDNVEWTVAQIEVDLLKFHAAILSASTEQSEIGSVRRRFDAFYSRITQTTRGGIYRALSEDAEARTALQALHAALETTVPIIDSADPDLRAALPALASSVEALRDDARLLSLRGVRLFADAAMDRRNNFVNVLTLAVVVGLALILLLGIALFVLERQRDLTQRRAAEAVRGRNRLLATTNAALDAIVVADDQGRIIDWNPAAETLFGREHEAVIGQKMADLIVPPKFRDAHTAGMERYRTTRDKRVIDQGRVELSAMHATGDEFPVELAISSSENEDGEIFVAYLRDISPRLAAEQAMRDARDKALSADRAKSEFLAVMSHEMRTPLNGVLGVLDLLERTSLDTRQMELVGAATRSGNILRRHINDVLDITRLEAGKMSFVTEPVRLSSLIDEVAEIGRSMAEANGNQIVTTIASTPDLVEGDPHRITQVLLNLVSNAAKFTHKGRIDVEVRTRADGETEFSVKDTGPGISAENIERIFEDFVTLDAVYTRTTPGTGLGLPISRRIVEGMGGEIGVDSTPGAGCRFWFRLPLAESDGIEQAIGGHDAEPAVATPRRILIVEDNEVIRMVLRNMLTDAGHSVKEARDGHEGVAAASADGFDVILMDISMPGMDGIEATQRIRQGHGPSRETPIIGVTAHALPEEQHRFAEAGMAACLTKPVSRTEMLAQIEKSGGTATGADHRVETPEEEIALIDEDHIANLSNDLSEDAMRRTLLQVCEELERGVVLVRALDSDADSAALIKHVHHMAGSAAIVGASRLHGLLAEIETHAKRGTLDVVSRRLPRLDDHVAETTAVLREFAEA